jgi:lipoate-protein ligase B
VKPANDNQAVRRVLEVRRLGRTSYADAHALQERLVDERVRGELGDQLLLTEHEPVVTLGRGADAKSFEHLGLPVVQVERGGDATYHGPGQLVAYPILALPELRRDLHRYLRDLEQVVIGVLAEVDVVGSRRAGLTGVWIGDKKVCSIGVAVRRWVTWHGFALNLSTDLAAFAKFKPCGLDPGVMTNLADHVELPPTRLLFEVLVVKHLCAVFGLELPPIPPPSAGAADDPRALPIYPG